MGKTFGLFFCNGAQCPVSLENSTLCQNIVFKLPLEQDFDLQGIHDEGNNDHMPLLST